MGEPRSVDKSFPGNKTSDILTSGAVPPPVSESPVSTPRDHRESLATDNLDFLTKIPGLSDAAREALLNVSLDTQNIQPAVDALFAARLSEQGVRAAMEQVLGALNLRAEQTVPTPETPAVHEPEPEAAPRAEAAEAPAESAAVPEEDELSRLARKLGLNEQVKNALAGVDLSDADAVSAALDQAGVSHREKYQLLSNIVRRPSTEAPAPAAVSQPEAGRRMPKLELHPRVAAVLRGVDLKNAAEVKAALSKFGTETRTQAAAQLARFRRAVDAAVAKLPKKPVAKESVAQSAQQQEPETSVESQHQTEVSDIEATGFAARFPAAIAAAEQFTDPQRLQCVLEAARQEYVRTSSGEKELKGVAKDLNQTVRALLLKGASGEEIRQKVSSLADELVIDVNATKDEKSRLQDANRSFLPDALRAVKALLPGENEKLSETAEAVQARILFLRGLGNYRQQQEILAKKHAALKNLETSGIRLQDIPKKKREEIERGRQRMESNIATMESVDGLLAHSELPQELGRAIEQRLADEMISHGTDQAAQYRSNLDRAIVDALGIEPRPRPAEQPEAAAPAETPPPERVGSSSGAGLYDEEIPPPEREAGAGSARMVGTSERTNVVVNEEDVEAYASGIREGRANAQQFAESLAELNDADRNREIRILGVAVDQLVEELYNPNDPTQAAKTKENLKKLGFALKGIATLAGVSLIIRAIEGAIGETFKIAES